MNRLDAIHLIELKRKNARNSIKMSETITHSEQMFRERSGHPNAMHNVTHKLFWDRFDFFYNCMHPK